MDHTSCAVETAADCRLRVIQLSCILLLQLCRTHKNVRVLLYCKEKESIFCLLYIILIIQTSASYIRLKKQHVRDVDIYLCCQVFH